MHFGLINGRRFPLAGLSALPVHQVVGSLPSVPQTPPVGYCTEDGNFIWQITADGTGYWARKRATDVCLGTWAGTSITTNIHSGSDPLDPNFGPFKAGPFSLPASPVLAQYVRYLRPDGSIEIPGQAATYLRALLQVAPPTIQVQSRTQGPIDLSAAQGTLWNFNGWCDEPITQASYQAWMHAIGFGANDPVYLNWLPIYAQVSGVGCSHTGLPPFYDQMVRDWTATAPVFGFSHPDTKQPWGVWLQLTTNGGFNEPLRLEIHISSIDHWQSLSQNSSRDLYNAIIGFFEDLFNLTCGLLKNTPAAAAKNPYIAAAKLSSLLVCLSPSNPQSPVVTAPPQPPWYLRWYVIVGVIGAVGLGLISAKSRTASTNP